MSKDILLVVESVSNEKGVGEEVQVKQRARWLLEHPGETCGTMARHQALAHIE